LSSKTSDKKENRMQFTYDEINTSRLLLRKPVINDDSAIFSLFSDEEILKYSGIKKHGTINESQSAIMEFDEGINSSKLLIWAVCLKPFDKLVGLIGILYINHDHHFGSFASVLEKKYWKKGIISEAHRAVISWAFENTELNRIESQFYENHPAVEKMLIKSGMIREGILRENFLIENKHVNSIIYSVTKNDYLKNPSFYKSV